MGSDTGPRGDYYNPEEVSIHAPAWGATDPFNPDKFAKWFQSTLPHGERRLSFNSFNRRVVSIHAPAWGATQCVI